MFSGRSVNKMDPNEKKKESFLYITWHRLCKNRLAMVGLVIIVLMALIAIFAPYIMPYGYDEMDLVNAMKGPTKEHWFGTDDFGRDILSRIMYGGRYSLRIGILAVGFAAVVGVAIGAIAGYYGGAYDMTIMRILDVFQAVPGIILSIAVSATLGPGFTNCIIALAIGMVPAFARMERASILNIRRMDYLEAAISVNCRDFRIIVKHVLPNALSPIIVQATMSVATSILIAASLSFIGLGVQPPTPEWGAMLSAGRNYIRNYPHMVIFPGATIMLAVFSLNVLGDGLRDALDPKLKQ